MMTKMMTRTHKIQETENDNRTQARRLLEGWGAAPLLFFALLPDKWYLHGDGGDWAVAYRKVGRHALALGDPLGDPDAAPEAVAAFQRFCRARRWTPAFYQVTPVHLGIYQAAGLHAVKVGEDAQIDLNNFSLGGKRYLKIRNDLRRLEKAGVVLGIYGPDAPPDAETVAQMADISAGWRQAHRAKEAGFAMGEFDPQSALFAESRFFLARDGETSRVLAFTTFVPAYGPNGARGWTLDLLRRRADAPHGVMDFLIVSAAQTFAGEGAALLSLGLSPLAGEDDPAEAAALGHVRRLLFTRLGRVYNFQGLHTFKSKFATRWEPRYLVYPSTLGLTATAGAILKAHLAPEPPPAPLGRRGRPGRRALALSALLLLAFTPLEKTLAKRAATLPRRMARTLGHHAPHWSGEHWNGGHWNGGHWRRMLPHLHRVRLASRAGADAPPV